MNKVEILVRKYGMKNFTQWLESLSSDDLQNELVLIMHHVGDIKESLHQGDIEYALEGLKDIEESVRRLSMGLSTSQVRGLGKALGS